MYEQPVSRLRPQVQAVDRGAQQLGQLSGLPAVQIYKQAAEAHSLTTLVSLQETLKEAISSFFGPFEREGGLF